jgi:hypothetical protein
MTTDDDFLLEKQRQHLWEIIKERPSDELRSSLRSLLAVWKKCAQIDRDRGRDSFSSYVERAKGAVFMARELYVIHSQEACELVEEIEKWPTEISR